MRWLVKGRFRLFGGQAGFTIIEVLVAVGLLAAIGVVFLLALSTIAKSAGLYEQRVTALGLAQSQMEIIKSDNYTSSGNYTRLALPAGYSLSINVLSTSNTSQNITVSVNMSDHPLFELKTIKADVR